MYSEQKGESYLSLNFILYFELNVFASFFQL
jgi:hypothetical protein